MNRPCHILFRSLAIAGAAFTLAACGQSETKTNEDIAKMRVLAASSAPFAKYLVAEHTGYYYTDIGRFFNRADWHQDAVELFADEKIYLAAGDQATAQCIVERILTKGSTEDKIAAAQELVRLAPRGSVPVQSKCSFIK